MMESENVDPDETDEGSGGEDPPGGGDPGDGGNAEAARWRRKLREAETEASSLRESNAALARQVVESIATGRMSDAADLWHVATLEDFIDEAGGVDPDKVNERLTTVLEERPHWAAKARVPSQPRSPRGHPMAPAPKWADALRPERSG